MTLLGCRCCSEGKGHKSSRSAGRECLRAKRWRRVGKVGKRRPDASSEIKLYRGVFDTESWDGRVMGVLNEVTVLGAFRCAVEVWKAGPAFYIRLVS